MPYSRSGPGRIMVRRGAGFFDTLKGFFSELWKKGAPIVKGLAKQAIDSGVAQDAIKKLVHKGTEFLTTKLDEKLGVDANRNKSIRTLGEVGSREVITKGQDYANKLLGLGFAHPGRGRHKAAKIHKSINMLLE